jgi:hypothetical protein
MYYQLLGQTMPFSPPHYRGTYRAGPAYVEGLPDSAIPNRAFLQYSRQGEKLDSRDLALQLAAVFRQAGQALDVIGIEEATCSPPAAVEGQLGFDVSLGGWYSLLSWGLTWSGDVQPPAQVRPLLALIERYFRPRLNAHGLFARWEDARFFLDVTENLSALVPGLWESPGHDRFAIVQLTAVALADATPNEVSVAAADG